MLKKHPAVFTVFKIIIIVFACLLYSIKANGITGDIFHVPLSFVVNEESIGAVGGGQNNHSKGGEKRPILGKLRNQQLSSLNLFSNRFA